MMKKLRPYLGMLTIFMMATSFTQAMQPGMAPPFYGQQGMQPYGQPNMQPPYGQPGMQPYGQPNMPPPYGQPGMQGQPPFYGQPGMQGQPNMQPYGRPNMMQPPRMQPPMPYQPDPQQYMAQLEDQKRRIFFSRNPGATDEDWMRYKQMNNMR